MALNTDVTFHFTQQSQGANW